MEKIGIVTIYDAYNFGNRLQAYALQEALRKLDIDSDDIVFKENIKGKIKNYVKYVLNYKNARYKMKRKKYFDEFDKNISFQKISNDKNLNIKNTLNQNYDSFLVGSDQVWNPEFAANNFYFLDFVSNSIKKNSYAASIGVSKLSLDDRKKFRDMLRDFNRISVREINAESTLKNILSHNSIETLIDPTLLLSLKDWEKVEKKPEFFLNHKYIFMYFLGNVSDLNKKIINQFAKSNHLEIIDILEVRNKYYYSGPSEFLYLLHHSSFVFTDSFHACVFSFIYDKNFIVFPRSDSLGNMSSRIDSFLNRFQLENRKFNGKSIPSFYLKHDYKTSYKILEQEKMKANSFLLEIKSDILKNNQIVAKRLCTGCSACVNACPKSAITMETDNNGFAYPKIDDKKCIQCNLCRNVCPVLNTKQNKSIERCFVGYAKRKKFTNKSSSGGIFPLIAHDILKNNGIVIGAAFDDSLKLSHIAITSLKDLDCLKGSKYLQSDLKNIFSFIKLHIKNKPILFVGTPCQVAGLKCFLKKDYENLVCVDLICHGVPTPKLFYKYMDELEKKYQEKLVSYDFRDKSTGWKTYSNTAFFQNKKVSYLQKDSVYMRLFLSNLPLRESCYHCNFKLGNKYSDVTLGDFWGIEKIHPDMYHKEGVSAIIINTDKGKEIIHTIREKLVLKKCSIQEIISGNPSLVKSCQYPIKRNEFFKDMDDLSTDELLKKFVPNQFIFKKILKKILRR